MFDELCWDHNNRHRRPTGLTTERSSHSIGSVVQIGHCLHEEASGSGFGSFRDETAHGFGEVQKEFERCVEELAEVRRQTANVWHASAEDVKESGYRWISGCEVESFAGGLKPKEGQHLYRHLEKGVDNVADTERLASPRRPEEEELPETTIVGCR